MLTSHLQLFNLYKPRNKNVIFPLHLMGYSFRSITFVVMSIDKNF